MGQNESKKNSALHNSKFDHTSRIPVKNNTNSQPVTSLMTLPTQSLETPAVPVPVPEDLLFKEVNNIKADVLTQDSLSLEHEAEVLPSSSDEGSPFNQNLSSEDIPEVNQSLISGEQIFKAASVNFGKNNQLPANLCLLEFGQQMDTKNEKCPNRKLLDRQRKNAISKRIGARHPHTKANDLATLKHVDKLAENLSGFALASSIKSGNIAKTAFQTKTAVTTNQKLCKTVSPHDFTLEECISQVKNINVETEITPTLHQALVNNLQLVNRFVSALKSAPVFSQEIITELIILKDYISSLPLQSSSVLVNLPSKTTTSGDQRILNYTNHMGTTMALSGYEDVLKDNMKRISQLSFTEGDHVVLNEGQNVIPLNEFKNLLDELPDELTKEKQNISLRKSQLYCRICEGSIPFDQKYLTEHLKSHTNLPKDTEFVRTGNQQCTSIPVFKENFCSPSPKGTALPFLDQNLVEKNPVLPPNYQGVLDIICTSHKDKLALDIDVYICRFCDIVMNNLKDAETHLSDTDHLKLQKLQRSKWEFCKSCCVYIFCTYEQLKEHCATVQHIDVIRMKNENSVTKRTSVGINSPDSGLLTKIIPTPVCYSVNEISSSMQKKPNPQEILLSLTKDHRNKIAGTSFGMYCQVCNDYAVYSTSVPDHLKSESHKSMLTRLRDTNQCEVHFCKTCQVDLFGDSGVLVEHISLPIHLELDKESKGKVDEESDSHTDELSNEHGAHFDLMKAVLMKHIQRESNSAVFGFYCHVCVAYFVDECLWRQHVDSASHFNRINSSECVGKKMSHDCFLCNIHMICDENTFSQHIRSPAHMAIKRFQERDIPADSKENIEESSDDNSDDDSESYGGDESGTVEDSDTQSNCSSSQQANRNQIQNRKVLKKGVYIRGLPRNIEQRDVFEVVKKFGLVKSCFMDTYGNARVIFQKKVDAERALSIKTLSLGNNKISVIPLLGSRKGNKKNWLLNDYVGATLQSRSGLRTCVYKLETDMRQEDSCRDRKQSLIVSDIYRVLPGCKVHFFGSQITGLATSQSDYDIYIDYDNRSYFNHLPEKRQVAIIHELLAIFTRPRSRFQVTEPVLDARVPIIRVIHNETKTPCDISCRSGLSVENSLLIRQYVSSDERVRWLVIVVKWWMRSNGLLSWKIFTSYATTWLVLFFLMRLQERILCPVSVLQKNVRGYYIAGWDCRFTRDMQRYFKTQNKQSKFELLLEFFKFYASFNLKNTVLCTLTATLVPRKLFDQLDGLPVEFMPYVKRVSSNPTAERLRTTTPICLQDPFDLAHNITKGVNHDDLKKFQALCSQSAKIFENKRN